MITNAEETKLERSRMHLGEFASAVQQLDLASIPPERRAEAITEHLLRIHVDQLESMEARLGASAALAIRKREAKSHTPRPLIELP